MKGRCDSNQLPALFSISNMTLTWPFHRFSSCKPHSKFSFLKAFLLLLNLSLVIDHWQNWRGKSRNLSHFLTRKYLDTNICIYHPKKKNCILLKRRMEALTMQSTMSNTKIFSWYSLCFYTCEILIVYLFLYLNPMLYYQADVNFED